MKRLFLLSVFFVSAMIAFGQYAQTLYNMPGVPQSILMNPAIQPESNFYFGLPVISSFEVGVGNNRFSLTDVIMKHPSEDSLITILHPLADKDAFLNKLDEKNYFYEDIHTNLFSLGLRTKRMYWAFNIAERIDVSFYYPKDLMTFALKGNNDFIGSTIDFSSFNISTTYFREYSLSISRQFGDKLVVGIRPKFLYGMANLNMTNNAFGIYNSIDSLSVNADMRVDFSGPLEPTYNDEGDFDGMQEYSDWGDQEYIDYLLEHNNKGFGIDFGFSFKPIRRLALSASVIDLGKITWDKHITNAELKGNYNFTGIDVTSELDEDLEGDPLEDLLDSLENSYEINDFKESYSTSLPTKVYFGASFFVTENFDLSVLGRMAFLNDFVDQRYTFSANARAGSGLHLSLSYSIMNGTYNNIGLGLMLKPGPFQIYVISDNISAALWGHETSSFNLRFGFNIAVGSKKRMEKKKAKDRPMINSFL